MRKIIILAALALFALPAAAQAHPHHRMPGKGEAAEACRAERDAGQEAFRTKYANDRGRRAFRRCVRTHLRQARLTCRTERQNDPAAFRSTYANERGRRAFRRCVRAHAGDPVA
jgi:hypothetical protein